MQIQDFDYKQWALVLIRVGSFVIECFQWNVYEYAWRICNNICIKKCFVSIAHSFTKLHPMGMDVEVRVHRLLLKHILYRMQDAYQMQHPFS